MTVVRHLFRAGPFVLALLLCGACSNKPHADTPTPKLSAMVMATFTCDDSTTIYAIFRNDSTTGKSTVSLAIGDERLLLPQAQSADGARYADSTAEFWNVGEKLTFTRAGRVQHCKTSP